MDAPLFKNKKTALKRRKAIPLNRRLSMVYIETANVGMSPKFPNEIRHPRRKNILIDYEVLSHLSGFNNFDDFQTAHGAWVESALTDGKIQREACWTQSIATGSPSYVGKRQLIPTCGSGWDDLISAGSIYCGSRSRYSDCSLTSGSCANRQRR